MNIIDEIKYDAMIKKTQKNTRIMSHSGDSFLIFFSLISDLPVQEFDVCFSLFYLFCHGKFTLFFMSDGSSLVRAQNNNKFPVICWRQFLLFIAVSCYWFYSDLYFLEDLDWSILKNSKRCQNFHMTNL